MKIFCVYAPFSPVVDTLTLFNPSSIKVPDSRRKSPPSSIVCLQTDLQIYPHGFNRAGTIRAQVSADADSG